ncbi:MAG: hypothetical protein FJ284_04545 [Planctomycetes bacterium]|nr:hypothetical protein [Planctomycetota bacterium]
MLSIENDRDLIAAVSQALGESRSLVRNRGFQLIEIVIFNGDDPAIPDDAAETDAVDLAAVAGLDWDCHDDSRLHRRCRRRRRVA